MKRRTPSRKQDRVGAYLPEIEIPSKGGMTAAIFVLSARSARRFGADCAFHVLPIWEDRFPKDVRPRRAVEAAWTASTENRPKPENMFENASDPLMVAGQGALYVWQRIASTDYGIGLPAKAAANACSQPQGEFWLHASPNYERFSAQAAMLAAQSAWGYSRGYDLVRLPQDNEEFLWQKQKIKEYLQLDAQSAMLHDSSEDVTPLSGPSEYIAYGTLLRRQAIEMLQLLRKRSGLLDKHQRLIIDCANELLMRDDAEFWVQMGGKDKPESAFEALINKAWLRKPDAVLKAWGPYKPSPKRPKKDKGDNVSGIQLWEGAGLRSLATIGSKKGMTSRVGADEIWDDPKTPSETLAEYAKSEPRVYRNPNLPFSSLAKGAAIAPWFIEQNPALVLLSLEEPEQYKKLKQLLNQAWLSEKVIFNGMIPEVGLRMFAADCAYHVLSVFEKTCVGDLRPRMALDAIHRFAKQEIKEDELERLSEAAKQADKSTGNYAAGMAAEAAATASRTHITWKTLSRVMKCAAEAAGYSHQYTYAYGLAFSKERQWQINRLRQYFYAFNPSIKPTVAVGKVQPHRTGKQVSVGQTEAWEDPLTPADRLEELMKVEPRVCLNPNLPWPLLRRGARRYPWYVERNPIIFLFWLEDPVIYEEIKNDLSLGWRNSAVRTLSYQHQMQYAADCAEHVLNVFKQEYPGDKRPEMAISFVQKYAIGQTTKEKVKVKLQELEKADVGDMPMEAANAVASARCAVALSTQKSAALATDAASYALEASPNREAEKKWQVDRARYYYQQEHPEYEPPTHIGSKTKWDNPKTNPQVLAKMAKRNVNTYTNPNLPWDALIDGARRHPWLVEKNPSIVLMSLEDPAKFKTLQNAISSGWVIYGSKLLSDKNKRLFAADCAEHVLKNIQADTTKHDHCAYAVHVAKMFAHGNMDEINLSFARKAVKEFIKKLSHFSSEVHAAHSAYNCCLKNIKDAVRDTPWSARASAGYTASGSQISQEYSAASEAEQAWQADRVRYYYQQENPEYEPPEKIGRATRRPRTKRNS